MDRIPILKMGNYLLVTIQVDLYDRLAQTLEADLVQMVNKTRARGVLIDISALSIVDSFMGRIIGNIGKVSKIMDAETVVVLEHNLRVIECVELDRRVRNILFARDFRGTPAVEVAVAPLVVVVGIGGGGHSVVITPVVRVIAG